MDNQLENQEIERNHRVIGQEQALFSISEEIGSGLINWLPNGGIIRMELENFWRKFHQQRDYSLVYSPHIGSKKLWETSKHLDHYKDSMFPAIKAGDKEYQLKPMNCPFHIMMYKDSPRSYRDLPVRLAELGTVYRNELSGALSGLFRVQGFTQDDAHIFCRQDQINSEINRVVGFVFDLYKVFGFQNFKVYLSTMPDKAQGDVADWKMAEAALAEQLNAKNIKYEVKEKDGAFYGPKIDITIFDSIGREWQCGTVQFDFIQPQNFDLSYVGDDEKLHRPFMVHHALFGCVERFFAVLVEHYAGYFPLWLAPVQCEIAAVQDDVEEVNNYIQKLKLQFLENDIRVSVSNKPGERIAAKVANAEHFKVPYVLVVGKKDVQRNDEVLRLRDTRSGEISDLHIDAILAKLQAEIKSKEIIVPKAIQDAVKSQKAIPEVQESGELSL